jgi:hypothetical protein
MQGSWTCYQSIVRYDASQRRDVPKKNIMHCYLRNSLLCLSARCIARFATSHLGRPAFERGHSCMRSADSCVHHTPQHPVDPWCKQLHSIHAVTKGGPRTQVAQCPSRICMQSSGNASLANCHRKLHTVIECRLSQRSSQRCQRLAQHRGAL